MHRHGLQTQGHEGPSREYGGHGRLRPRRALAGEPAAGTTPAHWRRGHGRQSGRFLPPHRGSQPRKRYQVDLAGDRGASSEGRVGGPSRARSNPAFQLAYRRKVSYRANRRRRAKRLRDQPMPDARTSKGEPREVPAAPGKGSAGEGVHGRNNVPGSSASCLMQVGIAVKEVMARAAGETAVGRRRKGPCRRHRPALALPHPRGDEKTGRRLIEREPTQRGRLFLVHSAEVGRFFADRGGFGQRDRAISSDTTGRRRTGSRLRRFEVHLPSAFAGRASGCKGTNVRSHAQWRLMPR